MQFKDQIISYFASRRGDLISDVCRVVRIDSVKGEAKPGAPFGSGPRAALDETLKIAAEMGFEPQNLDGYCGTVDIGTGERQLDILSHLDVVPVMDDWTVTKPFDPVERDGKLYGRGTADDKGPSIAALWAMKCVKDLAIPLTKSARLILGTDEESGSGDIHHYYSTNPEAPMTISPDADYPCIYIEKGGCGGAFGASYDEGEGARVISFTAGTRTNVIPGLSSAVITGVDIMTVAAAMSDTSAKTGVRFEAKKDGDIITLSATGLGAHASLPTDGNNALTGLISLIVSLPLGGGLYDKLKALSELFPHGDWRGKALRVDMEDEAGPLTIALTVLKAGNGVLDGRIDSRVPLCSTEENTKDVIAAALEKNGFEPHIGQHAPHYVPKDHPLVKELMKTYREYTGRDDEPLAIGGGTYVHGLRNGVAFGYTMPSTDNRMHGADENAVIDELVINAEMIAQVIADLCGN